MKRQLPAIFIIALVSYVFARADLNVTQPPTVTANAGTGPGTAWKVDLSTTSANSTAVKVDNSAVVQPASQSGTWTVQPGNTPNTSAWLTQNNPVTTSGNAMTAAMKASVTTSVNVKASAGNVYGVFALNGAASTCWVQFINSASAGTLGTGVIFSIPLPASITQPVYVQPAPFALSNFAAGIAVGIATTATGAVACGTAGNITVFYQ